MAIGTQVGEAVDRAIVDITAMMQDHYTTVSFVAASVLAVVSCLVLYLMISRIPQAWGSFVDTLANGWRAILEWPRKHKMRRDKDYKQRLSIEDAVEAHIAFLVEDGQMDATTGNRWRNIIGKVLPGLKPKKDVKMGIRARLRAMHRTPTPTIPGDPPAQATGPTEPVVLALVPRSKTA